MVFIVNLCYLVRLGRRLVCLRKRLLSLGLLLDIVVLVRVVVRCMVVRVLMLV